MHLQEADAPHSQHACPAAPGPRARLEASATHRPAAGAPFTVGWAGSLAEVREAQRLRWRVFVDEMGARLASPMPGFDIDLFDPYCDHLLVRNAEDGEVIGTYRVLTPERARAVGGLYSDREFDLVRLERLRPRLLELGRSCVHPRHRQGGVVLALWTALGAFMTERGLDITIGCASVPMRDGGHAAASLWAKLAASHLAPIEDRVLPRLPLPVEALNQRLEVEPPALVKGYLRMGAKVLGPPAWDPDFNTADLPMMFRLSDLSLRHRRHFLGDPAAA